MSEHASYASSTPAPARSGGSGFAIAALVLGVLAVLSCWTVIGGVLLGLVAIILGVVGWRRARRGAATGGGMAIAGTVLGVVGVLLSVLLIAVGVSFLNSHKTDFKNFQQCANDAGNNQQKMQKCQKEFNRQVQN